jgi:F0F1-type ATP synthase assembly protein I
MKDDLCHVVTWLMLIGLTLIVIGGIGNVRKDIHELKEQQCTEQVR